jgi:hypothetical protein
MKKSHQLVFLFSCFLFSTMVFAEENSSSKKQQIKSYLNPKLHYENMRLYVNSSWFLKIYFVKFTSVRKNQTLELTNIKNTNYYH